MKRNRTTENYEIIVRREQYLKTVKNRPIYFTDETRVNAEHLIAVHILGN